MRVIQARKLHTISPCRSGATFSSRQILFTAPAVVNSRRTHGSLFARLGQPAVALAACHHRDCLDWLIVLFRLFRQQLREAQIARSAGKRRGWCDLGSAWRGFLQPAKIPCGTEKDSHAPALVLLGELLHLALRLCVVHRALFVQREHLSD